MLDLTCVWWRIARSTWRDRDSRRKKNSRHDTHTYTQYTHTHTERLRPLDKGPPTQPRPRIML